jgi:hypothetical protein
MKSTRSRSRSKNNRNRQQHSGGNVVNRVFDSSGPEGKVRGTPSQVIEKYNQLARDATLSNDRVAAENFQQHAEHYLRMLAEAQREQDQRREEQDRQNRERQAERDRERAERQERDAANGGGQQQGNEHGNAHQQNAAEAAPVDQASQPQPEAAQPDVNAAPEPASQAGDTGLVETPESKPKPKRAPRRKPKPKAEKPQADGAGDQPEAAE